MVHGGRQVMGFSAGLFAVYFNIPGDYSEISFRNFTKKAEKYKYLLK